MPRSSLPAAPWLATRGTLPAGAAWRIVDPRDVDAALCLWFPRFCYAAGSYAASGRPAR